MPIKYVPFIPEPVEGQAVLGNFNRILRYKGADEMSMTLQRGMPLYEMEKQETVGKNADGNMVIRGECVSACAYLKEQGIQVDLVYIDPPFASGADYAKQVYIRRNPKVAEAIAEAEQTLDIDELKSFEEKMYGDVWDKEKYLNWMYENLMAIKSVMSETASIWVELDNHIGHYVKILLDEIFGEDHFVNEIVWKRTFSHSDVGQGAKHLGRLHDVIFLYSMSDEYVLNTVYTPYSKEYIDNFFRYTDRDGRRYRLVSMIGTGGAAKGNPFYEFMGVSKYWRYSKKTIQELVQKGLVVQTKPGAVPQKKNYLDESPGVPLQDVWTDIAPVQGGSIENANYTTQKPEALLERIIKTSSDENMVVAGRADYPVAFIHKGIGTLYHIPAAVMLLRGEIAQRRGFLRVQVADGDAAEQRNDCVAVAVKVNGRRSVRVGFFIGNIDLRIDAKRQDFIRRVGIVAVVVNVGVALCHIGVFIDTLGIHGLYRQGGACRGVCIRCKHVGRLLRTAGRQCQAQHTGQQKGWYRTL